MNKIDIYLFKLSSKYIFINILLITSFIVFINILEISRLLSSEETNVYLFFTLSFLKIPTIISDTLPFVIILSTSFLFKNLISNNELVSMRNIGFSILNIFKPIALSILIYSLLTLIIINPLSAKFERKFDSLTATDKSDMYSIKFVDEGMWIKNILEDDILNYINIDQIDLETMKAERIKILSTNNNNNEYELIIAKKGEINEKIFKLKDLKIINIKKNYIDKKDTLNLILNFEKANIIDSLSNYKFIPYYRYFEHIKSLKKFNLYSSEVSLYYFSEIMKPFFMVIIGFVVMSFAGKYKKNENFFKVLFISILIGFSLFFFKEIIITLTKTLNIPFIISYMIILLFPFTIGLYQIIKIESE